MNNIQLNKERLFSSYYRDVIKIRVGGVVGERTVTVTYNAHLVVERKDRGI